MMRTVGAQFLATAWVVALALAAVMTGSVAAQTEPTPTVGEIEVDSYDCDTGTLRFHVAVADLPYIPDSNGSLGFSVAAHYEQGSDLGIPAKGFNPEPDEAPYTGDVPLSIGVGPDAASSTSPESASGALQSIDISVQVVAGPDQSGPTDSSSTSLDVTCSDPGTDDSGEPTELPNTGAGTMASDGAGLWLTPLLSAIAILLAVAATRLRRRA